MSIDYKHTWTFSRRSRIIRFYLWAWGTDVKQITFCKLFWAYVFAPVAVVARPVWWLLWPLRYICRKIAEADRRAETERKLREAEPKEEIPGQIAEFFARQRPRLVAKAVGLVLLVAAGSAVFVALAWAILRIPESAAAFAYWFAHTEAWKICATIVGVGAFVGLMWVVEWLANRLCHVDERVEKRKQRKREAGEPTLGDVLFEGAKAVKSNTCPRVEVR